MNLSLLFLPVSLSLGAEDIIGLQGLVVVAVVVIIIIINVEYLLWAKRYVKRYTYVILLNSQKNPEAFLIIPILRTRKPILKEPCPQDDTACRCRAWFSPRFLTPLNQFCLPHCVATTAHMVQRHHGDSRVG